MPADTKKELLEPLMSFTGKHKTFCDKPKAEDMDLVNECAGGSDTDTNRLDRLNSSS